MMRAGAMLPAHRRPGGEPTARRHAPPDPAPPESRAAPGNRSEASPVRATVAAAQARRSNPLATTRDGRTRFAAELAGHPLEPRVRAHEAVHRAQHRAWRAGVAAGSIDQLEQEADRGAGRLLAGQRFSPALGAPYGLTLGWQPEGQRSTPTSLSPDMTSGPGPSETSPPICLPDETSAAASTVTAQPTESLASEREPGVCRQPEPGDLTDPEAVDVAGLRNDELNAVSLRVDNWVAANTLFTPVRGFLRRQSWIDPDIAAYERLQTRLKDERSRRVRDGHLWLTTATAAPPPELLMLMTGEGVTHLVSVDLRLALDVPRQSFPGPIMTRRQFEDHMAVLGVPILTEEEYFARLRQTAREIAPDLLTAPAVGAGPGLVGQGDRFRGYTGGVGQLDTRARLLQQTLPYRNVDVRAGDIGEAFAAPGLLRGTDYNAGRLIWSGDYLRPLRRTRGAVPVVDVRLYRGAPYRDISVKTVRPGTKAAASPRARTRYKTLLQGHADILDVNAPKFQRFAAKYRPGMDLGEVSAGMALGVPEDHVDAYRNAVRHATGFDLTESGNRATKPNYDLAEFRRIYQRTPLPDAIEVGDGGPPLRSGADVYAARTTGRISQTQFEGFIDQVGAAAADRVRAIPMHTGAISWYEGFLGSLPADSRARDVRAALNVDAVQVLEEARSRQQRLDLAAPYDSSGLGAANTRVSLRNARRAAGAQVAFTLAGDLVFNEGADLADPRYRAQLEEMLAVEGVAALGSEFGESYLRSRVGLTAAQEGLEATAPRLIAGRAAARALPGLADAGIEWYGMLTDERENSMEEVVTRTGRAAVIGAGSAWAGAAVGTAIGGPVGFVVGFAAGAAVGWLANKILPGGAADWERQAEIRRQLDEIERELAEIEALIIKMQERERRLRTPLGGPSASVAGIEAMFGRPTTDPMFTTSQEGVVPTVRDLEVAYLLGELRPGASESPR